MKPGSLLNTLKIKGKILQILAFCALAFFVSPARASEGHEGEQKKFSAGELITGHIVDAHDWHLWGEGANSVSIPLPVIVYSSELGLNTFMSSAFHHGHEIHNGFALRNGQIVVTNEKEGDAHTATVNEQLTAGLWDISITK